VRISMDSLVDDVDAESAEIRRVVAGLDAKQWEAETPALGWTVVDQVSHLAHYDELAVLSATDPEAFARLRARREAAGEVDPDVIATWYRHLAADELRAWFANTRGLLLSTFRAVDPSLRVPWFGPSMSAASLLTARLMETWAHGQDILDTFGNATEPTSRLRHVAHIGIGARAFSFTVNGLPAPSLPVRVELEAPDGELWTWGRADAENRVSGPALDFCLVVTQRRHRDDMALKVVGVEAQQWIAIAQAFAGKPGAGRAPGQFS